MDLCLSECLSTWISVCLGLCLSLCLSASPSVCLCLSVSPSVCLCLSVSPSVCLSLSVSLSLSPSASVSINISTAWISAIGSWSQNTWATWPVIVRLSVTVPTRITCVSCFSNAAYLSCAIQMFNCITLQCNIAYALLVQCPCISNNSNRITNTLN